MAGMKRVVNRYGKLTLASLGGCLVSIGAFLIILSSLTVTNVARAEDECMILSSPWSHWHCKQISTNPPKWYCCPDALAPCDDLMCNNTCTSAVQCPDNGALKTECNKAQGCGSCFCTDTDSDADEYACVCQ